MQISARRRQEDRGQISDCLLAQLDREGNQRFDTYVPFVGLPSEVGEAPKRYVGSQKVFLKPGEKQKITVTIDPTDVTHPLSYWDGSWKIANGDYKIYVGTSSRQILLNDVIKIHHSGN